MTSPRTRLISARIAEEVYLALCNQAKAQGITLSSLIADLLEAGCHACQTVAQPPQPEEEQTAVLKAEAEQRAALTAEALRLQASLERLEEKVQRGDVILVVEDDLPEDRVLLVVDDQDGRAEGLPQIPPS